MFLRFANPSTKVLGYLHSPAARTKGRRNLFCKAAWRFQKEQPEGCTL